MRQVSSEKRQMMLEQNIKSLIPKMALPPIVAQLITTVYSLVDTYFVSTLGTNATAAVGVNSSLERAITLIGALIGAGACSYIARLLGAQKQKEADRCLSTSFWSGLVSGVAFAAVGLILIGPLVDLLGATALSREYSIQYATYVLLAAPFMIASYILNMCLRSEGSSTYAMVGIGVGGVLNCFLDPLFIYTFNLGVAGASMATAISKFISFVILIWPYARKRCNVAIALSKVKFVWQDVKEVLSIGATSFLRSATGVLSSVIINRVAGGYSTSALAGISVATRIMQFPFAIILGFGQGFQPVAGFNWGAKRMDRVRECLKFSIIVSIVGSVVMCAGLFFTAEPLVKLFNSQADEEMLRLGILSIRLQCLVLVIHSFDSIINMFYGGIGKPVQALIMSTARQGYMFIPAILILPALWGVEGVAASQAAADILTLAVAAPLGVAAFKLIDKKAAELKAEAAPPAEALTE